MAQLADVKVDLSAATQFGSRDAVGRAFAKLRPLAEDIAKRMVERARANAPILEGDLRKGLFVKVLLNSNDLTLSFDCGGTEVYTLRRHEETYTLGPVSRQQPPTPEGGVGNKFFTRVIDHWQDAWMEEIETRLAELIGEEV